MGIAYNTSIVRSGLVLHLDAANPKSYPGVGTSWIDISGNSNNGVLINNVGFNPLNEGYLTFNGTNTYVSISDSSTLKISKLITIQCIFYINQYIAWAGLIGRNSDTKSVYALSLSPASQRLRFNYNNIEPWSSNVESTSTIPTGQWIYSAAVYDGTNIKIYLNGVLDKIQNVGSFTFDTATGFNIDIGYDNPGGNEYFNGNISLCSVYNRSLSDTEIRQNFEAFRWRYGL